MYLTPSVWIPHIEVTDSLESGAIAFSQPYVVLKGVLDPRKRAFVGGVVEWLTTGTLVGFTSALFPEPYNHSKPPSLWKSPEQMEANEILFIGPLRRFLGAYQTPISPWQSESSMIFSQMSCELLFPALVLWAREHGASWDPMLLRRWP